MPQTYHGRTIQHTSNGARFVWRISKKTGTKYKQYLTRNTKTIRSTHTSLKGKVFILNR